MPRFIFGHYCIYNYTTEMRNYMKYNVSYLHEKYLDDSETIWDYHTAAVSDKDVVDSNKTGMSFYDQFLNSSETDYLRNQKNLQGQVVYMSPNEYYEQCARRIFNTTVENLKRQRYADQTTINKLKEVLLTYKRKLCMPVLNYAEQGQEGLHRMLVIGDLYGWEHKVPVLVVDWYDSDLAKQRETKKRQDRIDSYVNRAIKNALEYNYRNIEELKLQLESELDSVFEYSDDITPPVSIQLKQDNEYCYIIFHNHEYEIDNEEIQWIDEDTDDELNLDDITEDDLDLSFLSQFLREKLDNNINKEDVVNALESRNNCIYWNTSMILDTCCEALYYDYNIDAKYKGRSIYVGDQKIATITVSKEGPNMIAMIGYKLFI